MHDIWNPWHGCVKCSEGCQNCYFGARCQNCGMRLICNGCFDCGRCGKLATMPSD